LEKMKKIWMVFFVPFVLTSCASFFSGISAGSLMSGKALNLMPKEKQSIVEEVTQKVMNNLEQNKDNSL
jgi:hypothetical protein